MNSWLFYFILLFLNLRSLTNVSERNMLKTQAYSAYLLKKYNIAAQKYQQLANVSYNLEPEVRLGLAHSYFCIQDTINALNEYKKLLRVNDIAISSSALIQIGIIDTMLGDSLQALDLFKEALQNDAQNKIARYNYELLKKKLPPIPPKNNNNSNTQNEINKADGGGETEKSEEKKDELDSTTPEKMSKEKALQILEAMKTTELQYSQQRKKTSNKNKKVEKDW